MRLPLLAALCALGLAGHAFAQAPAGAPGMGVFPGKSSNAPIDITADRAEVDNAKCVSVWTGSAEAIQEDTRLRADVIRTYAKPKAAADPQGQGGGCGATDRIEADGNVFYVTSTQSARGDHAVYSADADLVVMTGRVIVIQGTDVVVGDRLTVKVSTHEARMDSNIAGTTNPQRVKGVFYPNQPGGPGSPPPASH